jgi:hypothetical protein
VGAGPAGGSIRQQHRFDVVGKDRCDIVGKHRFAFFYKQGCFGSDDCRNCGFA